MKMTKVALPAKGNGLRTLILNWLNWRKNSTTVIIFAGREELNWLTL